MCKTTKLWKFINENLWNQSLEKGLDFTTKYNTEKINFDDLQNLMLYG